MLIPTQAYAANSYRKDWPLYSHEPTPKSTPTRQTLMRSSLLIYGLMALIGFEICWWYHQNTAAIFAIQNVDWFRTIRIGVVGVLFLTFGQHLLEDVFPSYRRLKVTFAEIFKGLNFGQVVVLSLLSSVGEEILFRGAMQPYLGVWFTSFIFAILHIDSEGRTYIWTVWAFLGGLVMGFAFEVTGTLWASIFIHFAVNTISIRRISRLSLRPTDIPSSDAAIPKNEQ